MTSTTIINTLVRTSGLCTVLVRYLLLMISPYAPLFCSRSPPDPPTAAWYYLSHHSSVLNHSSSSSHSLAPLFLVLHILIYSVLAGKTDRFASTHRVCRTDGHTFLSIKNKCLTALRVRIFLSKKYIVTSPRRPFSSCHSLCLVKFCVCLLLNLFLFTYFRFSSIPYCSHQGTGASAKQVRTEQLVLNELEFEWIRQFYIQGSKHCQMHSW